MSPEAIWRLKLLVAVAYDLFDLTGGRLLIAVPFVSEIVGTVLCCALFGRAGLFYMLEALDPTEQIDAFIPTATIIAFRCRPKPVENQAAEA